MLLNLNKIYIHVTHIVDFNKKIIGIKVEIAKIEMIGFAILSPKQQNCFVICN
jgi:hypothetical protein